MHIGAQSSLAEILLRWSALKVTRAVNNELIEHGHVYIAPPQQHMTMEDGRIALSSGPRENRHRPAIDPLFRSAAREHRSRTVGVILTRALDDGAAGLFNVKELGGIAVVQDPEEAAMPSMPLNAMHATEVDYVLPSKKSACCWSR